MANFDDMKLAVEALSGGKNTVLFDDMGMPSVMFPFVKQKYSDLMEGGTQETFPCFRIENEEKDVSGGRNKDEPRHYRPRYFEYHAGTPHVYGRGYERLLRRGLESAYFPGAYS